MVANAGDGRPSPPKRTSTSETKIMTPAEKDMVHASSVRLREVVKQMKSAPMPVDIPAPKLIA